MARAVALTHGPELVDQLLLGPLLLAHLPGQDGHQAGLGVVGGVRHVQVVHQHHVWVLKTQVTPCSKPGHGHSENTGHPLL